MYSNKTKLESSTVSYLYSAAEYVLVGCGLLAPAASRKHASSVFGPSIRSGTTADVPWTGGK